MAPGVSAPPEPTGGSCIDQELGLGTAWAELRCPAGEYIYAIEFAGLGNPVGTCDAPSTLGDGDCMTDDIDAVVGARCLGNQNCTLDRPLFTDVLMLRDTASAELDAKVNLASGNDPDNAQHYRCNNGGSSSAIKDIRLKVSIACSSTGAYYSPSIVTCPVVFTLCTCMATRGRTRYCSN